MPDHPAGQQVTGFDPGHRRGLHPSLTGILFVLWALLIPPFEADSMVNADGDPARHIRHGETILTQGDVIRFDPFSFTRSGEPYVGFEYGSQVLLALAYRGGGTAGMALLATFAIGLTLTLLTAWLLRRGLDPLLVGMTVVAAAVLTNIHWLARPHVFSWPFMIALLMMLERDRRPALWVFGLLFVTWTNIHGGWVFGWMMIGMYLAGHFLEGLTTGDRIARVGEWSRARGLVPALGVAVAVTIINPYGWRLPAHVVAFFRDPWLRAITQEFQSPSFHSGDLYPFLAALIGVLVLLAYRPRPHWTHLAVLTGTIAMALLAQRNIIQFALLAVPLLALDLGAVWSRLVGGRPFAVRFAQNARSGVTIPYVVIATGLLVALGLSHGRVAGRQIIPDGFNPRRFPVAVVEEARSRGVQGRMFHEFIWGGYLLQAWPEMKVFIDGGSDFYGGELLRAHRHVVNLQPGWADSLDAWRIDLVLVPTEGAMAAELLRESGWGTAMCDSTAALFTRAGSTPSPAASCPSVR